MEIEIGRSFLEANDREAEELRHMVSHFRLGASSTRRGTLPYLPAVDPADDPFAVAQNLLK